MTKRIQVISGFQSEYSVWLWDALTGTESVTFYDEALSTHPIEIRMWTCDAPSTMSKRQEISKSFDSYRKLQFTDANRRAVSLGEIHRAALQHVGKQEGTRIRRFTPPSLDEVAVLVEVGDNVMFRNHRDLEAHAQELRAVQAYLFAVVIQGSESPMTQVAKEVGLDKRQCRGIIERARAHGYLTRNQGGVGGELTEDAESVARHIRTAALVHMEEDR
jgi:hypothetical protein